MAGFSARLRFSCLRFLSIARNILHYICLDRRLEHMFEGEFTGDWVHADGEWHPEIHDPIDLDPPRSSPARRYRCRAARPAPGLAILLAGFDAAQLPDAGVLDRIVG